MGAGYVFARAWTQVDESQAVHVECPRVPPGLWDRFARRCLTSEGGIRRPVFRADGTRLWALWFVVALATRRSCEAVRNAAYPEKRAAPTWVWSIATEPC